MPKARPKQHITSTESENMLRELIPTEWTCESINRDYGLDLMIEIFNNGVTTGNQFYVQLKGTTRPSVNNTISCKLKTDNLDYYSTITLPVMLIVCQVDEKTIWGKWINNVDFNSDNGSKTINLSTNNIINQDTFIDLSTKFSIDIKYHIKLNIYSDNDISRLYNERLSMAIHELYYGKVSSDNILATHSINVSTKNMNGKIKIKVEYLNNVYIEEVTLDKDSIFLYVPYSNEVLPVELIKPLFVVSHLLFRHYTKESFMVYKNTFTLYDGNIKEVECSTNAISSLLDKNLLSEYQEIIEKSVKEHRHDVFNLFNSFWLAFSSNNNFISQQYIKNLLMFRETLEEVTDIACNSYTIANYYRNNNMLENAMKYYKDAASQDPGYNTRVYFLKELAGVMFVLKKYKGSEVYYKKCKSLMTKKNNDLLIKALIADTLIFQRKFGEALNYLKEFNIETDIPIPEYQLKEISVQFILDQFTNKPYSQAGSREITNGYLDLNIDDQINIMSESVNLDPLNTLSWFNLAHVLRLKGNFITARDAFMTCAILNREEDALVLSILHTINLSILGDTQVHVEILLLQLQLKFLFTLSGRKGINRLKKKLLSDQGGPSKENLIIFDLINNLVESIIDNVDMR